MSKSRVTFKTFEGTFKALSKPCQSPSKNANMEFAFFEKSDCEKIEEATFQNN